MLPAFIPALRSQFFAHRASVTEPWEDTQPAEINLSPTLCSHLLHNGQPLTCGLAPASVSQLWDNSARTIAYEHPFRLWHRRSQSVTARTTPGLQLAVSDTPITAWLAHPALFTILNDTTEALFGQAVVYFAPCDGIVVACRPGDQEELASWAFTAFMKARTPVTPFAITYRDGYPVGAVVKDPKVRAAVHRVVRRSRLGANTKKG
ncbi:MAG: hypothetical protein SPI77_05950 [Corynebacterium sp.]|nr:hypothetical protein [Corynebacterium sp.]